MDKSRAVYGVDMMVVDDHPEYHAKLLEVTFAPDMERFCWFQPEGFNELMGNLFFNEEKGLTRVI